MKFVNDERLTAAIGRVAIESALIDELIREMITDLLEDAGELVWVLFEGQTSEWLVETIKEMLEHVDPFDRRWSQETKDEFKSALGELAPLRRLRNSAVHGVWQHRAAFDDWLDRPWGEINDGTPIYYCYRSRVRKLDELREFSVRDVEIISEKIAHVRGRLVSHFRKMSHDGGLVRFRSGPLPRW